MTTHPLPWGAYAIRAINKHDLDALNPLLHSDIVDNDKLELLPSLYYEVFRETTATPELFRTIFDAVRTNEEALKSLSCFIYEYGTDSIWFKALDRHYFQLAEAIHDTFGGEEISLNFEELTELVSQLNMDALDFLYSLKMVHVTAVANVLYEQLYVEDLELDETTGEFVSLETGTLKRRCYWKKILDWLVGHGWTPHDIGSRQETDFRNKYHYHCDKNNTIQTLMCYIDDKVQKFLPDGVYIELASRMKQVYESQDKYDFD